MPHITWEELGNIKHILQEASVKMKKNGMSRDAQYFQGLIQLMNTLVGEHEDEEK